MPRISVVIPTFNRGEIFYECLNSVMNSISNDDEIIVVNDSKTHSIERNVSLNRVQVFDNPKSGVASARNFGASKATGEYLLFIDDDMLIHSDAIESCYQLILKNPNSVINSDWIYPPEVLTEALKTSFGRYLHHIQFTSLKGWCLDLKWIENGTVQANGITSQFLFISKNSFHSAGEYNESFPFAGFEDYDFGKRLENRGFQFMINTQCLIYHNEKDRIQLGPFLERKKRGGFTRIKGVELGHSELIIPFSPLKKMYFQCLFFSQPLFTFFSHIIPNHKITDPIYRFIINRLIGIAIYKGYTKKNIS
jgi:glycosyltransferase involved in cell wall biosynthesis